MMKAASCNIADVKFGEEVPALLSAAMDAARIQGTRTFADWMILAAFLAAAQYYILRHLGIGQPKGIRYSALWRELLNETGLDWLRRATQSNLLNCHRHRQECEELRATQPENRRSRWNSPNTLWPKVRRARAEQNGMTRTRTSLQEVARRLQQERDQERARAEQMRERAERAERELLKMKEHAPGTSFLQRGRYDEIIAKTIREIEKNSPLHAIRQAGLPPFVAKTQSGQVDRLAKMSAMESAPRNSQVSYHLQMRM